MTKIITKTFIKNRVKNEIYYIDKNSAISLLEEHNIKFKKSDSKDNLIKLITKNKIDLWEIFKKLNKLNFGMHPNELEELLNINKTIRKKLENNNIIEVAYTKESRAYGKYIDTPYYSLESIYNLSKENLAKWISNNYRKPSKKQLEGVKKAAETRSANILIKDLNRRIENEKLLLEYFSEFISDKYVILDTETTGLSSTDKIIDIAIIDMQGNVLIDTLVNTDVEISSESAAVNGLTKQDILNAPKFNDINNRVKEIIKDKIVLAYNASFDVNMLYQSGYVGEIDSNCLMEEYMFYLNTDRWISLQNAMNNEDVNIIQKHGALSDCYCCLELIKAIIKNRENNLHYFNKELNEIIS